MIALMIAASLAAAADPPWIVRPEDTIGRPYRPAPRMPDVQLVVDIESPSANPRWRYRVRYWSQERGRGHYVEREYVDGAYDPQVMISTRDCPALLPLLREVPRLPLVSFHVEGFSAPGGFPESNQWRFMIGGSAEHPGGQGGELVARTWQIDAAEPDPIARWARAFNRAFEACAGSRARLLAD